MVGAADWVNSRQQDFQKGGPDGVARTALQERLARGNAAKISPRSSSTPLVTSRNAYEQLSRYKHTAQSQQQSVSSPYRQTSGKYLTQADEEDESDDEHAGGGLFDASSLGDDTEDTIEVIDHSTTKPLTRDYNVGSRRDPAQSFKYQASIDLLLPDRNSRDNGSVLASRQFPKISREQANGFGESNIAMGPPPRPMQPIVAPGFDNLIRTAPSRTNRFSKTNLVREYPSNSLDNSTQADHLTEKRDDGYVEELDDQEMEGLEENIRATQMNGSKGIEQNIQRQTVLPSQEFGSEMAALEGPFDGSEVDEDTASEILTPTPRRSGVEVLPEKPNTKRAAVELDYEEGVLYGMKYDQLAAQPFDEEPAISVGASSTELSADEGALEKRLGFYSNKDAEIQRKFFSQLSVDEWECAGDWFMEQFTEILDQMKKSRRNRRTINKTFEDELAVQEANIRKNSQSLDGDLSKMKQGMQAVLLGKT